MNHDPAVCGIAYVDSCSACQDDMDASLREQAAGQRRRWVTQELAFMTDLVQGIQEHGLDGEYCELVDRRAEELAWAFAWRHPMRWRRRSERREPEVTWEYVEPEGSP